jgi:hypothetical protein
MKYLSILLAVLCLAGCMTDKQKASLKKQADQSVTCETGPDCEAKWGRAKEWIEVNTRWEIQTATDKIIKTYGPYDTSAPALIAHRDPDPQDPTSYNLSLEVLCNNMLGCAPSNLELQAGFAQFINDTIPDDAAGETDSDALGIQLVKGNGTTSESKNGGIFISAVTPNSPAARAGLHVGDQLLKLNGRSVTSLARAHDLLGDTAGGATYPVEISRGASQMIIYVRL